MSYPKWIRPLYIISALYDGILGVLFLVFSLQLFKAVNVVPPNHIGYVQFPALLLIIFAVMFFNIARDPLGNKNLILYGILLKFSYCSVVLYYWMLGSIPSLWVPFAFLDLAFMIAFIFSYKVIK